MERTETRTLAIIQARMGSSRLPGKVLLDLGGEPMLVRVVERTRRAQAVSQVMVATTDQADDDPVARLCAERGYACWRGSLHDVLDRYYQAARQYQAEVVVRITADCPVIDPELVDRTVQAFFGVVEPQDIILEMERFRPAKSGMPPTPACWPEAPFDFAANRLPPPWGRTYPIGLDTEVVSFAALERAWQEARQPYHREHVLPYLYEARDRFHVLLLHHPEDYGGLRWTVDTAEDLQLLRQVYRSFENRDDFGWLEILQLVQEHPELAALNAQIRHKTYTEVDSRRVDADTSHPPEADSLRSQ